MDILDDLDPTDRQTDRQTLLYLSTEAVVLWDICVCAAQAEGE